jgi:hypothetical protein
MITFFYLPWQIRSGEQSLEEHLEEIDGDERIPLLVNLSAWEPPSQRFYSSRPRALGAVRTHKLRSETPRPGFTRTTKGCPASG